jgi:hypothetical protein
VIARTRVAIIGTDGRPAAGWPVTIDSEASRPAFGSGGAILMTVLGLGSSPSTVVAYDRTGAPVPGSWPVSLPAGYGPIVDADGSPLPPVPGLDGAVYVAAVDRGLMGSVLGLDAAGQALPGWPYKLPQAFSDGSDYIDRGVMSTGGDENPGPMFARVGDGGVLYLLLAHRVVALRADGQTAAGWPIKLPAAYAGATPVWAYATPDGGLVAFAILETDSPDGTLLQQWIAFRWTAGGAVPK